MNVLASYRRISQWPAGRWLFSRLVCWKAPYFSSIAPRIESLEPGRGVASIAHRRKVTNHIGTVHAIAVCNGLEAAMGLLAEATIPSHRRWLPKGLEVAYLAKSTTDLLCIAETDPSDWADDVNEVRVRVRAIRTDGEVVVEGVIPLHVTDKPQR